jgi:hypothetical protein
MPATAPGSTSKDPMAPTTATSRARPRRKVLRASLRTVCAYGFAGSAYVATVAVFHPEALGQRVWHSSAWPHRDSFGAVAFAASLVACLILQMTGDGLVKR